MRSYSISKHCSLISTLARVSYSLKSAQKGCYAFIAWISGPAPTIFRSRLKL